MEIEEGLTAIGKQSGRKAEVIILETDKGITEAGLKERESDNQKRGPSLSLKGF